MQKFKRIILAVVITTFVGMQSVSAQYRTQTFQPDVKTLTLRYISDGEVTQLERPYLTVNDNNRLEIAFDQLSHVFHHYSYTIKHCNADWTESDLLSAEYIRGFASLDIDDHTLSENTQQLYTHYRFEFPNDDMQPIVSGNYVAIIYEDYDVSKVVATVCFSLVDPKVTIDTELHSHTAIEISGRYQQLDMTIKYRNYYVQNADQLTVVVQQNGRLDNLVFNPKPTFVENNAILFSNHKDLIFEGGNEYRTFDSYSEYILGSGVDQIDFDNEFYHVLLYPIENMARDAHYMSVEDADGQYIINADRAGFDYDYKADYMYVHFQYPIAEPYIDGNLYVSGDLTNNVLEPQNRMQYDFKQKTYYYTAFLKQGGYNYQLLFVPKNETRATTQRTEGSFWQTQNEYTIYVYHRPFGSRYDHLIGLKKIK